LENPSTSLQKRSRNTLTHHCYGAVGYTMSYSVRLTRWRSIPWKRKSGQHQTCQICKSVDHSPYSTPAYRAIRVLDISCSESGASRYWTFLESIQSFYEVLLSINGTNKSFHEVMDVVGRKKNASEITQSK
jgi:hypothetical protein